MHHHLPASKSLIPMPQEAPLFRLRYLNISLTSRGKIARCGLDEEQLPEILIYLEECQEAFRFFEFFLMHQDSMTMMSLIINPVERATNPEAYFKPRGTMSSSPTTDYHGTYIWLDSFRALSAKPKLSKISKVRHCKPSAWPLNILVPRLSMIRVLIPHRAAHVAAMNLRHQPRRINGMVVTYPAGPAPMIRRSQDED